MHTLKRNPSQALSPHWLYFRSGDLGWNNVLILFLHVSLSFDLSGSGCDCVALWSANVFLAAVLELLDPGWEDEYVPSHRGLDAICPCVLQWAYSESTPGLRRSAKKRWVPVTLAGYLGWAIGQRAEIYLHTSVSQRLLLCGSVRLPGGVFIIKNCRCTLGMAASQRFKQYPFDM